MCRIVDLIRRVTADRRTLGGAGRPPRPSTHPDGRHEVLDQSVELRTLLPRLCIVGGCCGTDHEHVAAIAAEFA